MILFNSMIQANRRNLLALICCLGFLFCFRPIVAFISYTDHDDLCYLEWAAKFIGEPFRACPSTTYPPGVGLMWLPASLIAKVSQLLLNTSFPEVLCIFVGLLSWLYWCGALFLTESIISQVDFGKNARFRNFYSLILLMNVPVLYYASHRTTLVHSPEIFLSLWVVYWLIQKREEWALLVAVLLTLVRINDAPAILLVLMRLKLASRWQTPVRILVAASLLGALIRYGIHGHNQVTFESLIHHQATRSGPWLYRPFFGPGWGLAYTAPIWLWAFGYALINFRKGLTHAMALLWMLGELIICILWWGSGADFGYRYIIGSYAAALWIGYQYLNQKKWDPAINLSQRLFSIVLVGEALWIAWLTWIYKERPEVTPYFLENRVWIHPKQLANSLELLFDPTIYLQPLKHSPLGALYLTYTQPSGGDSLRSGPEGAQFYFLLLFTGLALILTIYFSLMLRRKDARRTFEGSA